MAVLAYNTWLAILYRPPSAPSPFLDEGGGGGTDCSPLGEWLNKYRLVFAYHLLDVSSSLLGALIIRLLRLGNPTVQTTESFLVTKDIYW